MDLPCTILLAEHSSGTDIWDLCLQKIEHAGYTRYILQRNPVRYDSEGEELDDDDEDTEADAAVAEDNPFSEISLESWFPNKKGSSRILVQKKKRLTIATLLQ